MLPWDSWRLPMAPIGFPNGGVVVVFQGVRLQKLPGGRSRGTRPGQSLSKMYKAERSVISMKQFLTYNLQGKPLKNHKAILCGRSQESRLPIWQPSCYKDSYRRRATRWSPGTPGGSPGLFLDFLRMGGLVFAGFHIRRVRRGKSLSMHKENF